MDDLHAEGPALVQTRYSAHRSFHGGRADFDRRRIKSPRDARRNLFGPVDHVQTRRFLNEELARHNEEDHKRWNFNFVLEQPENGRWLWERVLPNDSSIPPAYAKMVEPVGLQSTRSATGSWNSSLRQDCACPTTENSPQSPASVPMETLTLSNTSSGCHVDFDSSFYTTSYMPIRIPNTPERPVLRPTQIKST